MFLNIAQYQINILTLCKFYTQLAYLPHIALVLYLIMKNRLFSHIFQSNLLLCRMNVTEPNIHFYLFFLYN